MDILRKIHLNSGEVAFATWTNSHSPPDMLLDLEDVYRDWNDRGPRGVRPIRSTISNSKKHADTRPRQDVVSNRGTY